MKNLELLFIICIGSMTSCTQDYIESDVLDTNNSISMPKAINAYTIPSNDLEKQFGDFCFKGTHNSYSGGDRGSIITQLNSGMSFFELDLWPLNSSIAFSTNWVDGERELSSMEYNGHSYVVNYRPDDGQISIDRFTGSGIDNVYQSNWAAEHRVFTSLEHNGEAYLVNYRADSGSFPLIGSQEMDWPMYIKPIG